MRRAALFLLLLTGCERQRELERTLAHLETQLARKQEVAQDLEGYRRDLAQLETRLAVVLAELGDAGYPDLPAAPRPLVVPPPDTFETKKSERLRKTIADTQRRLDELDKVLGEFDQAFERKLALERRVKELEALRAKRP